MSINHYSPTDLSETQLWSHYVMESTAKTSSSHHQYHHNPFMSAHHLLPSSTATFCLTDPHARTTGGGGGRMFNAGFSFNLNNEDDEELAADEHSSAEEIRESSSSNHSNNGGGNPREVLISSEKDEIPKEPLFEKPLTPSDVGKLNRLVIPKQHAEKHFPLNGGGGAAAAESGENGLLLSFEDEVGKSWRFRYSYWNSSQSYVLTKGWSRFVKEKRLDAGDIVVFSRRRGDAGRLFIGWRRRNSNGGGSQSTAAVGRGGGGGWNRQMFYSGQQYPYQTQNQAGPHSLSHQPECLHAGSIVQNQTPSASSGNSKTTLRLFGVNLECQSEPSTPVGSPMSGQAQAQAHYHHQYYSNNHMDISFSGSGDVYRQG